MRNKLGTICMLLGAVLLLAALSLLFWNQREDREAGASVERILPQVVEQIEAPATDGADDTSDKPACPDPYDPTMTEVEIDGCAYVGYLSIPSAGLELPVMSEWNYARLKLSPCRYTGSTKTGDLVICAHNYTRHFGPIKNLSIGDAVYFTDMDGMIWEYEVATVDILQPTDIEDMTAGDYDLTLFTCTYGGISRVTVRCEGMDNGDSILKQGE